MGALNSEEQFGTGDGLTEKKSSRRIFASRWTEDKKNKEKNNLDMVKKRVHLISHANQALARVFIHYNKETS